MIEDEFTRLLREFDAGNKTTVFDSYINREFEKALKIKEQMGGKDNEEK